MNMNHYLEAILQFIHPYRALIILCVAAFFSLFIARKIFVPVFKKIAAHTKGQWDDMIVRYKGVERFAHIVPAAIIAMGLPYALKPTSELFNILSRANNVYFILVAYLVFDSLVSATVANIQLDEEKRQLPIRGLSQALKLVVFILSAILMLSQISQKSPVFLLSGLGALTAVLMLVFKDTILGFVAGIQIIALRLIHVGDWIEFPKGGADGTVVDVSLTSVRIRNWDNSVTSIPTYELVSSPFKNWRAMSESGGRRIQRSLSIDVQTVGFLTALQIRELLKIRLLRPYLEQRLREIEEYNAKVLAPEDFEVLANGRHLTNLGTFRAYCVAYLESRADISKSMTLLVRQLQTGPEGQPIQIYAFTTNTDWIPYENIQSDIFDHLIAVLPLFGLRLFQAPAGNDLHGGVDPAPSPKKID